MALWPISKVANAPALQAAITPDMGKDVWLLKKLTRADAQAPQAIWMPPKSAEALPALRENGARDSADELGNVKPWQARKMKIRKMVLYNPVK